MKYIKLLITSIIVLSLLYMGYNQLMANKEIIEKRSEPKEEVITTIPVKVAIATMEEKDNLLSQPGSFEARRELSVFAEGQGRITQLFIEEGQAVSKGQKIAKLDDTSIQVQLQTAQASLDKYENDVKSYTRLLDAGAISRSQLDEVVLAKKNAEANIASITQQFSYTTAHAPISGIIKELNLEQGSFASPGLKIATIVDVSQLKMIIKVAEEDIIKIRKGQAVTVVADVYPEYEFKGRVNLIGIQADAGRKYEVEINMPNHGSYTLKPGMYGTVRIPTEKILKSLYVPRKSIIGSLKNPQIYIATDSLAELRDISIGSITGDKVEVLSGVIEGEKVIITGQMNLQNNSLIKIII